MQGEYSGWVQRVSANDPVVSHDVSRPPAVCAVARGRKLSKLMRIKLGFSPSALPQETLEMSSTPNRRSAQATEASAPSFVESLSRLRASSSFVLSLLSSPSSSNTGEVLAEVKTLKSRLSTLESSVGQASVHDKAKAVGWEDEVDAAGTLLWNKATALRHAYAGEEFDDDAQELKVVAERTFLPPFFPFRRSSSLSTVRRVSYRLIHLGTLTPLTPESVPTASPSLDSAC
jgi:hypothetical protein